MKKAMFLLSVLIVFLLVAPPDPADVKAAAPQDVMAGYWVLTFEDGRVGWANLVSDDYAKTSFSSKGKVEVPGFKQVDITSGVIPESLQGRPGDPVQRPGNAETIPLRALRHRGQPVHDGLRGDIRQQAIQIQGPPPLGNRGPGTENENPRMRAGIFLFHGRLVIPIPSMPVSCPRRRESNRQSASGRF